MSSPFLARNAALLVLCLATFVFAAKLAFRPGSHVVRALTTGAATLALLVAGVASAIFAVMELSESARSCWTRTARWSGIRAGMAPAEVAAILGPAMAREPVFEAERWIYALHPFGPLDEGAIEFSPVDGKVREKWPGVARPVWITPRCRREATGLLFILAAFGLAVAAAASLIPWPLKHGNASWPVYLPASAVPLTAVTLLVNPARGAWGIDLVAVGAALAWIPIVAGWFLRTRG